MREIDGKPVGTKKGKLTQLEVAELIVEIERLRPKVERIIPKLDLLSRKEAAQYINATTGDSKAYTPKSLANLASRGSGPPYIKFGKGTFYLETDINAWIWSKRIVPDGFYHEKERNEQP